MRHGTITVSLFLLCRVGAPAQNPGTGSDQQGTGTIVVQHRSGSGAADLGRATHSDVVIRSEPSERAREVARLKSGDYIIVTYRDAKYDTVVMAAGPAGYVSTADIQITPFDVVYPPKLSPSEANSLLWVALDANDVALITRAIRAGANVSAQAWWGRTPLMYAAGWSTEAVPLLLRAGARVNSRDEQGMTALMYAIDKGNFEVVNVLLESRADPNIHDRKGLTALGCARREHVTHNKDLSHEDWVALRRLLRRHGAR